VFPCSLLGVLRAARLSQTPIKPFQADSNSIQSFQTSNDAGHPSIARRNPSAASGGQEILNISCRNQSKKVKNRGVDRARMVFTNGPEAGISSGHFARKSSLRL
jgi:hypothetical protein